MSYASHQKAISLLDPLSKGKERDKKMEKDLKFEELKESITFEELEEMLQDCISYDGYFEDLDYQPNNDEFFEIYFSKPIDAVRAAHYGSYNYMDDYVKFNAYGNLDSCSEYEREKEIEENKEEIIDHYLKLYSDDHVYPSESLKQKLYTYYEENEEESEDQE